MSSPKWRRTKLVHPDLPTRADDWSLVEADGNQLAHLWNTEIDDLIGSWRWRVWIDHKMTEGSAHSGAEARATCEQLLGEKSATDKQI